MIRIITDSTCDVPQPLIDELGIEVVPQVLIWGQQQYRDRVDIQAEEFYQRVLQEDEKPHSSFPDEGVFRLAYENAVNRGADELVMITLSSSLSGTHENAKRAGEGFPLPITVVDSNGTSMGLGWQVVAAARAARDGADRDGIVNTINRVRGRITQMVGMDTLEYLNRGGRIGAAAKWAGTLLKIKPLVAFDVVENQIDPIGLARTYTNMIETLYRKFFDRINGKRNLRVAVLHGNRREIAESVAERIREEFNPLELFVNSTGPVVGLHTGPGALGLCGYADE